MTQSADEAGAADPAGEGRDVHVRESVSPVRGSASRPETPGETGATREKRTNNTNRLDAECMTRV